MNEDEKEKEKEIDALLVFFLFAILSFVVSYGVVLLSFFGYPFTAFFFY